MTTFEWIISAMECRIKEEDLNDVVVIVHWRYNATAEIEGKSYFADTFSSTALPTPSEGFTPYADLTKEQVVGWLENILDAPSMQLNLEANIQSQANPIMITFDLPFGSNE